MLYVEGLQWLSILNSKNSFYIFWSKVLLTILDFCTSNNRQYPFFFQSLHSFSLYFIVNIYAKNDLGGRKFILDSSETVF